jgi:class 3 adenylate cyclase
MTDLADLPTGTVTFLFTDLEGSTGPQQAHPAAYREAVRRHHDLLLGAVAAHGGVVFETVGDAVYAAFARPTAAVAAALAGQVALQQEPWGATGPLRARMGVHLGEVEAYRIRGAAQGARYFGLPLARCARLMATAHGGQTVLSEAAAALVRDALPAGAGLRDLGAHRLKDLQQPEWVYQLLHPDLPAAFPPLRSLDALPNNLPLQLTSFVGREPAMAAVRALLAKHRLVTLTGPGGTGKTRLALQVAAELLPEYADGVWLVELAPLADPALVPQAAAVVVGVREEPGRPLAATLADALRRKHLLLVLDNCEHVLDAGARLAELGGDVARFPTAKHLASWAGMCPGNRESAGKRQSGATRKGSPWLRGLLVQVAHAAARTRGTYLAAQYRRLAARRGKSRAAVAVGHTILVIVYHLLRYGTDYHDLGPHYFDERARRAVERRLVRRLEGLGYRVALEPRAA